MNTLTCGCWKLYHVLGGVYHHDYAFVTHLHLLLSVHPPSAHPLDVMCTLISRSRLAPAFSTHSHTVRLPERHRSRLSHWPRPWTEDGSVNRTDHSQASPRTHGPNWMGQRPIRASRATRKPARWRVAPLPNPRPAPYQWPS